TDLGSIPDRLRDHLCGCDVLLIESNHDESMLAYSEYPESVKARIRSARGHLSNRQTQRLLRALDWRTHAVVLMHLSRMANTPDKALAAAHAALLGRRVRVYAAMQDDALLIDAADAPPPESIGGRNAKTPRNRPLPGQLS